jgi:hypothetical protein
LPPFTAIVAAFPTVGIIDCVAEVRPVLAKVSV